MSLQFPSSPSTGQTFPAPLQPGQPSWVWDGAKWTSRGLANAMVATSPLPPLNPRVGDLWFDPVEGNTYLYFDDGNSQQWVVTTNQPGDFPRMGVADGSDAVPGEVGELILQTGTNVSAASGVWLTVTTLSLAPGDWDVHASINILNPGAAATLILSISASAASQPTNDTGAIYNVQYAGTGSQQGMSGGPFRSSSSTAMTVYVKVSITGGTSTINWNARARRMR